MDIWDLPEVKQACGLPDNIPSVKIGGRSIVEVMSEELGMSKNEARRLVKQGAVDLFTYEVQDEKVIVFTERIRPTTSKGKES